MNTTGQTSTHKAPALHVRSLAGIMLIAAGAILFLDQYLKTVWLTLLILPAAGLFLFLYGARLRHSGLVIVGGALAGFGVGVYAAYNPALPHEPTLMQIGYLLAFFGLGWLGSAFGSIHFSRQSAWWALIPAFVSASMGACILFSPFYWTDIVLFAGLGVALPLLVWGILDKLYGLVIPGSLLLTIGPGIYLAWGSNVTFNSVARTGVMLIWFALGWVFITVFSRLLFARYAWWPLIPGGILAVVGFGLYIGGDPGNALGFISNTGSIGLIIFGLYLLLMRKGIHH